MNQLICQPELATGEQASIDISLGKRQGNALFPTDSEIALSDFRWRFIVAISPPTCHNQAAGAVAALAAARKLRPLALEILCSPHFAHLQKILNTATTGNYFEDWQPNFIETYQPYYADGIPTFYFMEDDLDRINALVTPLDDYVSSMEAKFITGEISIEEEYDTFVATLEQYGVQEYVDIYNSYYAQ